MKNRLYGYICFHINSLYTHASKAYFISEILVAFEKRLERANSLLPQIISDSSFTIEWNYDKTSVERNQKRSVLYKDAGAERIRVL